MKIPAFIAIAFLLLLPGIAATQEQSPFGLSVEVTAGLMSYYFSDDPHPLAAAAIGTTIHDYVRVYVEGTRVWARQSLTCLGSCGGTQNTAADPLWYGNAGLQLILPLGVVRPYVGGDIGRLFTCGPEGFVQNGDDRITFGGRCASRSLEGGVRVRAKSRIDGRFGIQRRYDDRFGGTMKTNATEFRMGLGYILR